MQATSGIQARGSPLEEIQMQWAVVETVMHLNRHIEISWISSKLCNHSHKSPDTPPA